MVRLKLHSRSAVGKAQSQITQISVCHRYQPKTWEGFIHTLSMTLSFGAFSPCSPEILVTLGSSSGSPEQKEELSIKGLGHRARLWLFSGSGNKTEEVVPLQAASFEF